MEKEKGEMKDSFFSLQDLEKFVEDAEEEEKRKQRSEDEDEDEEDLEDEEGFDEEMDLNEEEEEEEEEFEFEFPVEGFELLFQPKYPRILFSISSFLFNSSCIFVSIFKFFS